MAEAQAEMQPLVQHEEAAVVYPIIHIIRADVMHFIDTPLTYEALSAPDLTYTLVRPLVEKYCALQHQGNQSIVFCFLVNRVHFVRDENLGTRAVSRSRAELCEILAIQTLRDYGNSMLDLTLTLTTSWPVYAGAASDIIAQAREERDDDLEERVGNAIEMAIISKSKRFIKSSSCQKVIDGIWTGKCVYQAESNHSFLSDTYKRTPVHFYDPHKAPLLDHYRLKVPAIRSVLEYSNFLCLFILFVVAIEMNERDSLNTAEIIFMVYALGFSLEKVAAMQEHGISVYFKGTWNGFDLAFVTIYCIYAFLRLYGIYHDTLWARSLGVDILAIIACLMFPRLAFVTLKDNLMVLALRAMMMQFLVLMLIAAFCFCGFLYALWTLSRNEAGYSAGTIAWWMLDLWFGLDASGFDRANQFHPVFGPLLMVTYACLSNTLLLTVLVSILSHTFTTINEDAAAEAMFRKAVSTIEGVKADSLFSYQPPVNLVAITVMLPASYILSPRWFHKVNVFMIRITSFPLLLSIALYERQAKMSGTTGFRQTLTAAAEKMFDTLPRQLTRLTFFEGLAGADADIDAIFEIEDELSSALDTRDYGEYVPEAIRQQRSASTNSPPPNGKSNEGQLPHVAFSPPRTRVQSLVHRGAEAAHAIASPLAQIFQPLFIDDDIPEDEVLEAHGPPVGVSYGPAHRRRLSSTIHRRPTMDTVQPVSGLKNFPVMGSPNSTSSTIPDASGHSEMQGGKSTLSQSTGNETAGQVEDDIGNESSTIHWARRMEVMEERQKRIEDLLIQISGDMRTGRDRDI